jgi:hypothetical protein
MKRYYTKQKTCKICKKKIRAAELLELLGGKEYLHIKCFRKGK